MESLKKLVSMDCGGGLSSPVAEIFSSSFLVSLLSFLGVHT